MGVAALCVAVGLLTPFALEASGGPAIAVLLLASLGLVVSVALTLRWPWIPVIVYWLLYSFFSDLRSLWQLSVGPVPLTIPDFAVGAIAVAVATRYLSDRSLQRSRPTVMSLGLLGLLFLCLASALVGLSHQYPLYSIAIDLRDIAYLMVGYLAAHTLLHARRDRRLLTAVMWMSVIGFLTEQTAVSITGFRNIAIQGGSLETYRDIGVSFFAGKYGIFMAVVTTATDGLRRSLLQGALALAGLAATAASLIRTAWIDVLAGIAFLLVATGVRGSSRLVAYGVVGVTVIAFAAYSIPQTSTLVDAVINRASAAIDPSSVTSVDTVAVRFEESRRALAHLQTPEDWLIGAGLGLSVQDALHPYQHNSYVWYLSKLGIIGLLAMCAVLVLLPLVVAIRALRRASGDHRVLLLVLTAAHVANVVSGYASGHLTNWEYAPLVGMTIGWIFQLAQPEPIKTARVASSSPGASLTAKLRGAGD